MNKRPKSGQGAAPPGQQAQRQDGELPGEPAPSVAADSETVTRRKEGILAAAMAVFAKKGFDGSRTREIAAKAGVSEATIFKYFPNKQQLLSAVLKPLFERQGKPRFLQPVLDLVAAHRGQGLASVLELIVIERWQTLRANQAFLGTLLQEAVRRPELLAALRPLLLPEIMGILVPLFREAQAKGEIAPCHDPEGLARRFMALVIGTIALELCFPLSGEAEPAQGLRQAVRDFVPSLRMATP